MPDSLSFDFSDLTKLAADLGEVPDATGPFIRSAFEVTSRNVKKAAQDSVKNDDKSGRWSALPGAIGYDITAKSGVQGSSIESEIGYNKTRYGDRAKTGNLREYGAPGADGVPLAPHNDLLNALHENEADFQKGLEIAIADGLKAAGL